MHDQLAEERGHIWIRPPGSNLRPLVFTRRLGKPGCSFSPLGRSQWRRDDSSAALLVEPELPPPISRSR